MLHLCPYIYENGQRIKPVAGLGMVRLETNSRFAISSPLYTSCASQLRELASAGVPLMPEGPQAFPLV